MDLKAIKNGKFILNIKTKKELIKIMISLSNYLVIHLHYHFVGWIWLLLFALKIDVNSIIFVFFHFNDCICTVPIILNHGLACIIPISLYNFWINCRKSNLRRITLVQRFLYKILENKRRSRMNVNLCTASSNIL